MSAQRWIWNEEIKAPKRAEQSLDDWWYEAEMRAVQRERGKLNGNGSQFQRVMCRCPEGWINGKRVAVHRPEDCAYSIARSALVPAADLIAISIVGDSRGIESGYEYTRHFVKEMERLSRPLLNGSNGASPQPQPQPEPEQGVPWPG